MSGAPMPARWPFDRHPPDASAAAVWRGADEVRHLRAAVAGSGRGCAAIDRAAEMSEGATARILRGGAALTPGSRARVARAIGVCPGDLLRYDLDAPAARARMEESLIACGLFARCGGEVVPRTDALHDLVADCIRAGGVGPAASTSPRARAALAMFRPVDARKALAASIAAARKARGMTSKDFAAALGVARSTAHYYESGRFSPSLRRAAEMAAVLGVDPESLIWYPVKDPGEAVSAFIQLRAARLAAYGSPRRLGNG